ncbi:hypothetical protein VB780_08185 [Leptolyngbya sp. CCNP1308]|uniref:hypothetical protein n=1 Tax=Leptolyngbya sp. CCNP1308 TaxID=3110255 RepID=UPI002B1FED0B|nr:hypothetical protein [Leptolyngbya sp. CCNP1308]MEA5448538.1 hypothetical protein [Leptolyngbya sp. CCNP1308]
MGVLFWVGLTPVTATCRFPPPWLSDSDSLGDMGRHGATPSVKRRSSPSGEGGYALRGLRFRTVQTLRHPWRGEMPLNSTHQAF